MRPCGATRSAFALHFGAGAPVAKRKNHAWCWPREQGRLNPHPPKSTQAPRLAEARKPRRAGHHDGITLPEMLSAFPAAAAATLPPPSPALHARARTRARAHARTHAHTHTHTHTHHADPPAYPPSPRAQCTHPRQPPQNESGPRPVPPIQSNSKSSEKSRPRSAPSTPIEFKKGREAPNQPAPSNSFELTWWRGP